MLKRIPRRTPGSIRVLSSLVRSVMAGSLLATCCTLSMSHHEARGADPIELKDLDGHFPFTPPESQEGWESRREKLRKQILISQGMWPMPNLKTVQPVVHSEQAMDGYSISKVYFESLPGLFVTGTLYRPLDGKPAETKRPGILCPHGHWDNGRFYQGSDKDVRNQLATGAERFMSAARNPMQARSVQLARMGCVVFLYDMIGYADSQQISFERVHRFGLHGDNPERTDGSWLLFSPQAEGYMQSVMGLQTINTLQSLEFLIGRDDVDAEKIAITGASGGGTQTFIAAAIDSRFAAAMPAVMVGTRMQGGCTCENASLLRVGTGNVEIAAMIAPRPMGLTTADDWTKDLANDGFAELKKVYGLYDASKKVELFQGLHFPHNYNHVARVSLYGFINRVFELGFEEPILERDFEFQTKETLTVWDEQNPAPESGIEFEAKLLRRWRDDLKAQVDKDPRIANEAWKTILEAANLSMANTVGELNLQIEELSDGQKRVLGLTGSGRKIAEVTLPSSTSPTRLKMSHDDSASSSGQTAGTIYVADPYGLPMTDGMQGIVKNPRLAPAYTYGYNSSLAVRRAAVMLQFLERLSGEELVRAPLILEGKGGDSILLRLVQKGAPGRVAEVRIVEPISSKRLGHFRAPEFVPGALLYGL